MAARDRSRWLVARRAATAAVSVLLLVWLTACGEANDEETGSAKTPVITPAEPWEGSPLAEVEGHLALQEGCLLLDSEIVFWPHGTTWDDASRAVVFEDASPAQVGAQFAGGGGHYSGGTDFTSLLGQESGDAIDECKTKTDASGVVFAYP